MKRTKNGIHIATTIFFIIIFICCNAKKGATSSTQKKQAKKNHLKLQNINNSVQDSSFSPQVGHKEKQAKRSISVSSKITDTMLAYRWGWSDHTPTSFYLEADSIILKNGETKKVTVGVDNILEVTYHYEFKNGLVKGSKTIELEIPTKESHVNLSFSWKNSLRVISDVGRAIKSKNGTLKSPYSLS